MNPSQARFAPAQVANTIKSALPPTWNTGFTSVTAAERAVAYRSNMNHYRGHVRRSLAENDLLQVAEKSWGATRRLSRPLPLTMASGFPATWVCSALPATWPIW